MIQSTTKELDCLQLPGPYAFNAGLDMLRAAFANFRALFYAARSSGLGKLGQLGFLS